MNRSSTRVKVDEFGDFQTPVPLARRICRLLADRGETPASVVEPTCGVGNFLFAAFEQFPGLRLGVGVEIQSDYVNILKEKLRGRDDVSKIDIVQESFFNLDWKTIFLELPEPILVVGNPPWVTNSALGLLGSTNLPKKSNFQNYVGLKALTGKSNFDISESMLIEASSRCSTAEMGRWRCSARPRLRGQGSRACLEERNSPGREIHAIDATAYFKAAVDACLLACSLSPSSHSRDCRVYRHLDDNDPATVIGYHDNDLLADVSAYQRWKHLRGEEIYRWRSGVKHDCVKSWNCGRKAIGSGMDWGKLSSWKRIISIPCGKVRRSETDAARSHRAGCS